MKIHIQTAEAETRDTMVVPLVQNGDLKHVLSRIGEWGKVPAEQLQTDFLAERSEVLRLYLPDGRRLFLLGLGKEPGFADVLKAFRSFSFRFGKKLPEQLSVSFLFGHAQVDSILWAEAAVNGLVLGTYHLGRFKTEDREAHPLLGKNAALTIYVEEAVASAAKEAAGKGQIIAEAQMSVFDLVNAPSNKKTPGDLASWALDSGERYGYQAKVFHKKEIEKAGLFALLAVNQGSPTPPVFIVMEYIPKDLDDPVKVGLVGKGVTFDTGGLSIKPSSNMHLMKSDMGGAAAVFGTMEAAARLRLPVHLIGVVPATDNSVDANSVKPSDVIDSHSGKTIEIIDTDAEGRLILADGLSYITQMYHPDILIDLATLTGSTVRTFGYHAAGLFSNNDELVARLFASGLKTGERIWRLPIWDVYKEDLESDVADIRNFSGKPVAGAIGAAKFLEVFTFDHPAWAHLDIAGVAFQDSEFASQRSATGFGIRLLIEYLKTLHSKV